LVTKISAERDLKTLLLALMKQNVLMTQGVQLKKLENAM
jgi:hypothetical protein